MTTETISQSAVIPYELSPDFDNLSGFNRLERALNILTKPNNIKRIDANTYTVKSQRGLVSYLVTNHNGEWKCTCPDCISHENWECKHILAVKGYIQRRQEHIAETKTKRDWASYTMAQKSEGELFQIYLRQIVDIVEEPKKEGKGRKSVPLADNLYMAIAKVNSQLSTRRAYRAMMEGVDKDYNVNGVCIFLNRPEITPILRELLQVSASPLSEIESNFAIDASGFGTYQFNDWTHDKWNTKQEHKFMKSHIACGVISNIITDAIVTDSTVGDMNVLPTLLDGMTGRFTPKEVYADAGYLSNANYTAIKKAGAEGFIWFKKNVTGKGCPAWRDAFTKFLTRHSEFVEHYSKRNNVESVFASIKLKLGERLKSKNTVAQINELYCKLIAYNISVVIRMAHTDSVKVMFA